MDIRQYILDWGHSGARAVLYGTISVGLGGLPNGRGRDISRWCMHRWCKGTSEALGVSRSVIGADILANAGQCVVVANHVSTADIIILGSVLTMDYRWLAKAPLFNVPFTGWHLRFAGHVPVYRGEQRHKNSALAKRIHQAVEEGASMMFFPEGTRSETGHLTEFRIGAFMAAIHEGLPILPVVLRGTAKLMKKNAPHTDPDAEKHCSVAILPEIFADPAIAGESDKQRAERLRDRVWDAYRAELYGDDGQPPRPDL